MNFTEIQAEIHKRIKRFIPARAQGHVLGEIREVLTKAMRASDAVAERRYHNDTPEHQAARRDVGIDAPATAARAGLVNLLEELRSFVNEQYTYSTEQRNSLVSRIDATLAAPTPVAGSGGMTRVADGLEACDWSGVPIGNKAIITHAVSLLRAAAKPVSVDAPTAALEITPNTLGGFRGAFYVANSRAPTEQEVFDAGVKSGMSRAAPTADVDDNRSRNQLLDYIRTLEADILRLSADNDSLMARINAAVDDGGATDERIVADWIKSRGTSMNGEAYAAAVQLVAFAKTRASMPERKAVTDLLSRHIELNMSNYGPDEVDALNAWAIEAYDLLATTASDSAGGK